MQQRVCFVLVKLRHFFDQRSVVLCFRCCSLFDQKSVAFYGADQLIVNHCVFWRSYSDLCPAVHCHDVDRFYIVRRNSIFHVIQNILCCYKITHFSQSFLLCRLIRMSLFLCICRRTPAHILRLSSVLKQKSWSLHSRSCLSV